MKSNMHLLKILGSQILEHISIRLVEYKHRSKSRAALLKLDDIMLKDIGITRKQAIEEGNKAFWKTDKLDSRARDNRQPNFQSKQLKHMLNRLLRKPLKSRGVSF